MELSRGVLVAAVLFTTCAAGLLVYRLANLPSGAAPPAAPEAPAETAEEQAVRSWCASCHLFTDPSVLPRDAWATEIGKMYDIAARKGLTHAPPQADAVAYFEARAPAQLDLPRFDDDGVHPGFAWRTVELLEGQLPAISDVRFEDGAVVFGDMRSGRILRWDPRAPAGPVTELARIRHPALFRFRDLDGDGRRDLLLTELGSFYPEDHQRGALHAFRATGAGFAGDATLLARVGRVADVNTGDLNGDGHLDIVASVFGWRFTGKIVLLMSKGPYAGTASFDYRVLDHRAGALHAPIADINGDGHLDIVALLSQEHEEVTAFLGDGSGGLERTVLYRAPHPDWGSAGIELADTDGDGDLDVILMAGDFLENAVIKPTHGIYLLENPGSFPFVERLLATLPTTYVARTGDLDGDGDLDIVAGQFLPGPELAAMRRDHHLPSLSWFENQGGGSFEMHVLERHWTDHPSLALGDIDGDGDLDIVAGNFLFVPGDYATKGTLTLLENRLQP